MNELKKKSRKKENFQKLGENKSIKHQNIWYILEIVLKWKFMALSVYIKYLIELK